MASELEEFKSNGFFVAKGLVDTERVDAARKSLALTFADQLLAASAVAGGDDLFSVMQALHKQDIERYKKVAGAIWRKLDIYKLLHDEEIIEFLREKFGWQDIFVAGGQVVHIMAHELAIPGGYFGLVPHQDFPSVQGSLDGVIVWLPLVDIDRDNFPLELIPGSHRKGLLVLAGKSDAPWEVRPDQIRDEDFTKVFVSVGDVVFISFFTVHRTSNSGKPGRYRLALSTRLDNAREASFIERCYPCAYERSVRRDPYFPGFPTEEQVEEVFQISERLT